MEKFLEFINTAPVVEISSLLTIKPAAGKKIIAARPISSLEELAALSGLPLEKLNGIASTYEMPVEPEPAIEPDSKVAAIEDGSPEIVEPQQPVETEKHRRRRAGMIWKVILWLIILAAIAAALYFGIPLFKEKILKPLETNTSQVGELTTKQQQDVATLQQKITDLQNQISTLEGQAASAEGTLASYQETLSAQDNSLTNLTNSLATARTDMNYMDGILATQVGEQQLLDRVLQLLSRARLYLSQSNNGLARDDIAAARSLLFNLLDTISPEKEVSLRLVIERLDFALSNLPAYPVVAVYDLDIAWQLLVDNLPPAPELMTTPAVYITERPTGPTPTPEITITPTATITETAQP